MINVVKSLLLLTIIFAVVGSVAVAFARSTQYVTAGSDVPPDMVCIKILIQMHTYVHTINRRFGLTLRRTIMIEFVLGLLVGAYIMSINLEDDSDVQ